MGLAPAFLVLAGKNSGLISADEVEISSRLPYKSRVELVVVVLAETKTTFIVLVTVTSVADRFLSFLSLFFIYSSNREDIYVAKVVEKTGAV